MKLEKIINITNSTKPIIIIDKGTYRYFYKLIKNNTYKLINKTNMKDLH